MRAVVGIQEDTTILQAVLHREHEEAQKQSMKFNGTEREVTRRGKSNLKLSAV